MKSEEITKQINAAVSSAVSSAVKGVTELKGQFTKEQIIEICEIIATEGWLHRTIFIAFDLQNLIYLREYLPKFVAKGGQVLTLEPHLKVFSALKDLEAPGDESKIGMYKFESKREAFDCAVNSLKEIIKEI